jgi:uncharacterized phiE125 gp8 family phage protein
MASELARVVVVTPPEPFITLDQAKGHLRVTGSDEDSLIDIYRAAACAHIDGPLTWLGRSVGQQTLRAYFDSFDDDLLRLPGAPLLTVSSVVYDAEDGTATSVAAELYTLDLAGALVAHGESWPTARDRAGAVRVEYTAGYAAVPKPIVAAALLMIGDLYQNRETTALEAKVSAVPMSTTVEALLSPYRIWTL